ncbi:NUDIX hydrolase [Niallia sp.]|uniref:NUDIX hydrolase n=1 Tax=Niallia sp. TaxID=2837523 RepID=UPI0028A1856C|nr:NUDIX hydrolase [Niallia sp.]
MEEVKVVYALIRNRDTQILMVKNHEGHWSFPGGKVETGESLEEAVIREVEEETGLIIKPGKIVAINEGKFLKRNNHAIFFTFEGEIVGGMEGIIIPEEILQLQWFHIEEADKLASYYADGISELLLGKVPYYNQGTI